MPCCGLHEHRVRVPVRYMASGALVFWGMFVGGILLGVLTCWSAFGRSLLRIQGSFLSALWQETMRSERSVPARLSCRLSGYLFPISPRMAAFVFRHPELPSLGILGMALLCPSVLLVLGVHYLV